MQITLTAQQATEIHNLLSDYAQSCHRLSHDFMFGERDTPVNHSIACDYQRKRADRSRICRILRGLEG